VLIDLLALQRLIGSCLGAPARAPGLALQRLADVVAVDSPGGRLQEVAGRQRGHLDMQVDAIQQRAAEPALVARTWSGVQRQALQREPR
jgi:hypothetical protein